MKTKKYQFRNLNGIEKVWYITGEHTLSNAQNNGILEWCTCARDAEYMLASMESYREFDYLSIGNLLLENSTTAIQYLSAMPGYTTKIEFHLAIQYVKNSLGNVQESNNESLTEDQEESDGDYYEELNGVRNELKQIKDVYFDWLKSRNLSDFYYFENTVSNISNKPMVDFERLKTTLRPAGSVTGLKDKFVALSQDELKNLAVFFECMKNPKFAILASRKLK